MDIPSLEENVIPFGLFDQIEDITYIELLVLGCLVVLMDLAQHADN